MPFGIKSDLSSGTEIDFDHIYKVAIKPAIESVGLESLRADEETSGGIIHAAMFARLVMAEFVVADLTLANPNVFYELGVRHAAKPFTTVPIFATTHALPFDVGIIRAIPYNLDKGVLSDENATTLRNAIEIRLRKAKDGPKTSDSPLFQLLPEFPGIDMPHEVTDAFQERVNHEREFSSRLNQARNHGSNDVKTKALLAIQMELGDLKVVQRNILVDLLLSFRSVEAWDEMVALSEQMPHELRKLSMVQQQTALALNRRNAVGDRNKASEILEDLIETIGPDPETCGLLGRIYKDQYKQAKKEGSITASADLDDAINMYTRGFESDPRDYYPGINAIMLLIEKGDEDAMIGVKRLLPLVNFAVERRGTESKDYWDLATTVELACIGEDWAAARKKLPSLIKAADESWKPKTTHNTLQMLKAVLDNQGRDTADLNGIILELQKRESILSSGQ